jgi:hypothetical protein
MVTLQNIIASSTTVKRDEAWHKKASNLPLNCSWGQVAVVTWMKMEESRTN